MGLLSISLIFTGYVLIYASVAGPPNLPGAFTTAPWLGIFEDAYNVGRDSAGGNK